MLTIFFSGGKQSIGAGTTSEVYSTRLTGGTREATRKRIFALRPFAPRRLPSPPLRHGMSNSSTRYERRTRHSASIARRILKHALRAARHGIPFPLHVEFKHAWRAQHGYALHTQRVGHSSCYGFRSVHWPLRARRTHSRGAYLFFASMSAIDHDGARTTAVNLRHPFVVGIVRFERCAQCLVLLVGGFVFDFHIDQAAHR